MIKGTELYNWWKGGKYTPYSTEDLVELLATVKQNIPPYVRIQRIMRDIPAPLIEANCKNSNLRQLVQGKLKELKKYCKCIRCREFGIITRKKIIDESTFDNIRLYRLNYEASKGNEIFLSYENKEENYLVGLLRLRKPSVFAHRPELNDGKTLIVREIKVVGEMVPKDAKPSQITQIQHRGYGKLLMKDAEKISAEDFDAKKLAVISGIGAREFFYSLGYKSDGPYVSKLL